MAGDEFRITLEGFINKDPRTKNGFEKLLKINEEIQKKEQKRGELEKEFNKIADDVKKPLLSMLRKFGIENLDISMKGKNPSIILYFSKEFTIRKEGNNISVELPLSEKIKFTLIKKEESSIGLRFKTRI